MIPILRFTGFNDEWTSNILEKNAKIYDGTHQTPNYVTSGVRFVSVENIDDIENTDKFISPEDFNKEFKVKPQKDDILMTRITAGIIGATTIVKNNNPLGYYVSLALIRKNKELDVNFLNQYINSTYFKKELNKRIIHVAFPKKINLGDIGKCWISYPSLPEQEKIGLFLSLIDKKIELQSKKIISLTQIKNGILESELNKDYPLVNLRKILKERKLYSEKGLEYPHVTLSKDGIFDKGDRYNRDFLVKSADKQYKITRLNDLCYNPANLKFGVICLNEYGSAIFSPIYVTFEIDKDVNPKYIKYYTMRNNFINAVRKYEQGTVYERMAVSPEGFLRFDIKLPDRKIQDEIVNKIDLLDSKINLESKVLEELKLLKKGLMQNMFV